MKNTLTFAIPTDQRKALARHIGNYFQEHPQYTMPGFRYVIDGKAEVLKDATVVLDDNLTAEERTGLLNYLLDQGFRLIGSEEAEEETEEISDDDSAEETELIETNHTEEETETDQESTALSISLPDDLTDAEFERLQAALDSKKTLIQHSLQNDGITLKREGGKIIFDGFPAIDSDHYKAYADFAAAVTKFAKNATRISSEERTFTSEKYAFRGFLLRLGMNGPKYKKTRKILLENLTGSAAFPTYEKEREHTAKYAAKLKAAKSAENKTPMTTMPTVSETEVSDATAD